MLLEQLGNRRACERRLARERVVEHAAQAVDVGAAVGELRAAGQLGGHVHRPTEGAFHDAHGALLEALGEAQVGELHAAARVEEDVGWLDVAVDEHLLVGVVERLGGLGRNLQPFGHRQMALLADAVGEAVAIDELHGDEVEALFLADVEGLHHVGMVELGSGLGFAAEGREEAGVAGGRWRQHLECHPAVQPLLHGFVDRAQPAPPDDPRHLVAAELVAHKLLVVRVAGRQRRQRSGRGSRRRGRGRHWRIGRRALSGRAEHRLARGTAKPSGALRRGELGLALRTRKGSRRHVRSESRGQGLAS